MSAGSELLSDIGRSGIQIFHGSVVWDAASIDDGNEVVTTVTVPGASVGDFVLVSSSLDVVDLTLVGQVTAANTVTIQLGNWTGGALNLGSGTYHVLVLTNPYI